MSYSLLKIDELLRHKHSYLAEEDICYYLSEYHSGLGYGHSEVNQDIINYKKPLTEQYRNSIGYKYQAIDKFAGIIRDILNENFDIRNVSIVPIPPSKKRDHLEYDDRNIRLLNTAFPQNESILDILDVKESVEAHHLTQGGRPHPDDLKMNYVLNGPIALIKPEVILFDDLITSGSHFVASKRFLCENFPKIQTVEGLFLARRVDGIDYMLSKIFKNP